ncbi:MAG: hypothetical protein OXI73_08135 [Rhodospirillales bacterium]|nr:hypothetical protein [Rhodospirillales bacterium]
MTEAELFKIGCVVAALIGYGLIRWRLLETTHDFRVRAGCDADQWAADRSLPMEIRQSLQGLADGMYRSTMPWLIVLGTLIAVLMPYRLVGRKYDAAIRSLSPEARKDFARLNVRLFFAAVTTSPLAGLVILFVLLVGLLVRTSVEAVRERIETFAGIYLLQARAFR